MPSIIDMKVREAVDAAFAKAVAPGGWLREQIRLHAKWVRQGFEPGFGWPQREAFTQSVADYIHEKARRRLTILGVPLWLVRWPHEQCAEEAERIVTEWLRDEQIKFGDSRFYWDNGRDLAEADMEYWDAA